MGAVGEAKESLTTTANDAQPLVKDDLYYLDFAVFEAEETLKRVPRYHFTRPPASRVDPLSEEDPEEETVVLQNVLLDDFHQLLTVLYPLTPTRVPQTSDNWISILHLSTRYQVLDARKLAIAALQTYTLSSLKQLVLGQQYGLPEWLLRGYLDLVKRGESITLEEAKELGLPTYIKLCQVREAAVPPSRSTNPASAGVGSASAHPSKEDRCLQKIDSIFEKEFMATNLVITDTIERILLARSLGVVQWLRYSYFELACRHDGLTEQEAEQLGLEASVGVYQVRETMLISVEESKKGIRSGTRDEEYVKMLSTKFEWDLGEVKRDGAVYSGLADSRAVIVVEEEEAEAEVEYVQPQAKGKKKKKRR